MKTNYFLLASNSNTNATGLGGYHFKVSDKAYVVDYFAYKKDAVKALRDELFNRFEHAIDLTSREKLKDELSFYKDGDARIAHIKNMVKEHGYGYFDCNAQFRFVMKKGARIFADYDGWVFFVMKFSELPEHIQEVVKAKLND